MHDISHIFRNLPDGPVLGWRPHSRTGMPMPIYYTGDKGIITVAPNRTGKGTSAIGINAISHRRGSFVCLDPKAENSELFARYRALALNQPCHMFDPLQAISEASLPPPAVRGGPVRAGFNPIDMVRTSRFPVADAKMCSSALIPIEGNNPFFPQGAQSFLAGAMCFVALHPSYPFPRTMRNLWRDLTQQPEADFQYYLKTMAQSPAAGGFAAGEAIEWLGGNQESIKSIRKTMKTSAGRVLDDPNILECLSHTSLNFGEIQRTPTSVFIVLPGWASEIYSGFMRLLLSCMFTQIERAGLPPPGVKRPKTLIIMDEFSTLRRSETVREALPRLPGYGVQFWPLVQDFNQLKILYDAGWETFVSNAGVIQFFGGAPDVFTADYLSRMTGVSTIHNVSVNQNNRIDGGGMTTSSIGRPLLFPHEITNLNSKKSDEYKQVLIFAGKGLAFAQRSLYYRDFPDYTAFMKRDAANIAARTRPKTATATKPAYWQATNNQSHKPQGNVDSSGMPNSKGHWRNVLEDDVFPPGGYYRVDLNGASQVWVAGEPK